MKTQVCALCGNEYTSIYGSIYRLRFAGKMYRFCSYTCYRNGQKVVESAEESEYRKLKGDSNENK